MEDVVEVARALVRDRHPSARAAFLCGSVLTHRRTPTSDLDVVVLLPGPPAPYRENLVHQGWPVELFAHTDGSWHRFVDREVARRRSPLLRMCATGALVLDADGSGARLAREAARRLAAGPPAATGREVEDRRYALTDLLDDLAGCRDEGELVFVVTELASRTASLALTLAGGWLGGGKWLMRELAESAPDVAARLPGAARTALSGDPGPLTRLAQEVLARAGGRLWEGYRREGEE